MKNLQKKMLIAGGALVIGSTAVLNFLVAQPKEQLSDLTLANIELFAAPPCKENLEEHNGIFTVTVCNKKTDLAGVIGKVACNADATTACQFSNIGR